MRNHILASLDIILKYATLITIIIGSIKYIYHIAHEEDVRKVRQALATIHEFRRGDAANAVDFVSEFWLTNIPPSLRKTSAMSQEDMDRIFRFYIAKSKEGHLYIKYVSEIFADLDGAAYCSTASICDRRLINGYFCQQYKSFQTIYRTSASYLQQEGIDVGKDSKSYFNHNCYF